MAGGRNWDRVLLPSDYRRDAGVYTCTSKAAVCNREEAVLDIKLKGNHGKRGLVGVLKKGSCGDGRNKQRCQNKIRTHENRIITFKYSEIKKRSSSMEDNEECKEQRKTKNNTRKSRRKKYIESFHEKKDVTFSLKSPNESNLSKETRDIQQNKASFSENPRTFEFNKTYSSTISIIERMCLNNNSTFGKTLENECSCKRNEDSEFYRNYGFSFRNCSAQHRTNSSFWRRVLWAVIVAQLFFLVSSRTVRTKYGDVSGVIVTPDNRYLDAVEVFKGIPYASPPVGSLRFMPPVSGAMWQGVKMANRFSPVCPQKLPDISNETAALRKMPRGRLEYLRRMIPYLRNQSEDCLYLNIYVPHVIHGDFRESPPLFPVLVYIHGDSYMWGAGSLYDGTVLSSYGGLVVVSLNYRLGVLGFLNTNTGPSNFGLMDQIAALHWVQENIASFGGDPRNVTVMGHGTGAACVHLLATSTAVPEGALFQRVILMSGSALCPWALSRDPGRFARQVSRHAGCPLDRQLMSCLRQRPLEALLSAPGDHPQFVTAFGPSVDGVVVGGRMSEEGEEIYPPPASHLHTALGQLRRPLVAKLSRYPLLLGTVRLESYFAFTADDVQYGVEPDRKARLMRNFVKNTYRYHQSEILATVVNEYTDWERPVQHPINIRDETMDALSDAMVVAPIVQTADLHSSNRAAAFMYVFDYQTRLGDYPQKQGCVHGEELPYVFGAPLVSSMMHFPRNFTKTEVQLSEMTMDYWTNFIKTGSPNLGNEADLPLGIRLERQKAKIMDWLSYDKIHKRYLYLDMKPKMKNHYRAHRLSFWLNLVPDLHRPGSDDVPHSHHQLDPDDHTHQVATPPTVRPPPAPSDVDVHSPFSPPPVVVASSASKDSSGRRPQGDFTTPTALRATIAVGGTLLFLNVVVFLLFYRKGRDVKEGNQKRHGSAGSVTSEKLENGGPMSTICVTSGATDLSSVETRLTFTPIMGDSYTDLRSLTVPAPEEFQGPITPETPEFALDPPEVPSIPDIAPPLPPKTSKARTFVQNETLPLLSESRVVTPTALTLDHDHDVNVTEDVLRV